MSAITILDLVINLFYILILARVVLSFIRPNPYHPVVRFIHDITEPLLAPIRRLLPPTAGLDFSPLILLILISFLRRILISALI